MARSMLCNVALVGVGIVFGAACSAFAAASSQYWHGGRVIEHDTERPLNASVVAWPEMKRTGVNGSCPTFGSKALDIQTSINGAFKISIDQSQYAYTVVYCLNDFVPRVDFMPNRRNGASLDPTPAQLWPAKIDDRAAESFDIQVDRSVIGFLNELSYLMTVDEKRFAESINRLVGDFSKISNDQASNIRNVQTLVSKWKNATKE